MLTPPRSVSSTPVRWPGLVNAFGDPVQLKLAVLNLALNARDAMRQPDCKLTLTGFVNDVTLTSGEYVELSVTDIGSGMPSQTIERALEPFFTTKEVGKDTGLGLSQVIAPSPSAEER
jgi:signal transduction histidine kinase